MLAYTTLRKNKTSQTSAEGRYYVTSDFGSEKSLLVTVYHSKCFKR